MVKQYASLILSLLLVISANANDAITPSLNPAFPRFNQNLTVTYDVTGTALSNLNDAYAWVWIPNTSINASWNVNPASNDPAKTNNAKFTKSIVEGRTLFTITFKPSDFFTTDISTQPRMGILLKGNDFSNGQTTDYIINFWDGNFQINLTSPQAAQIFVNNGQSISINAQVPQAADFDLFVNDVLVNETNNATSYTYNYTVSETSGTNQVRLVASIVGETAEETFQFLIASNSPVLSRPAGIIPGINYNQNDASRVTLCLLAPGKSSVYVLGDFNDWNIGQSFLMNRDGEHFWIELTNLTAGIEYGYQYLVNQTIRVADPYSDKILDPDDQYIPSTTYPNLKAYPTKALSANWYENRVSVFQTNQTPYNWQTTNFEKPPKENLIIYEALIRDLFDSNNRNYQSLIDTLSYLKRLGINAIELMPVMEFNGNEGWGYNPTFMFAPDKYYGTKNKLKEFIDKCHEQGLAVILDIAMNHQDVPNTYAAMYFDFNQFKPAANPWFNTNPTHPFNVFFDMNHESEYTKKYLDTVNYYWLNEFKIDGYRFDLSKGFTQKNTGSNVGNWSAYDASRIALLKRMADKIWEHSPDAYVILEHLGVNQEEQELAQYRANEGKGMLFWAKMTDQYNQNTMGFAENSTISGVYHKTKSWSVPHVVGYMESHDEERLMYKNITFGKVTDDYSVKDLDEGLRRVEAAFACFLTIPGPKMMWQFGELGYDQSINRCTNGTISNDCRLTPKPLAWDYTAVDSRAHLFDRVSDLLRIRNDYSVFRDGDVTFNESTSLFKAISIKNSPYTDSPTDPSQMNVQIVANFDVVQKTVDVTFPHTGVWYDYKHGGMPYEVTTLTTPVTLSAGGYFIFTDVPIDNNFVTAIEEKKLNEITVFPNPGSGIINTSQELADVQLYDVTGKLHAIRKLDEKIYQTDAPAGVYILTGRAIQQQVKQKLIIQ